MLLSNQLNSTQKKRINKPISVNANYCSNNSKEYKIINLVIYLDTLNGITVDYQLFDFVSNSFVTENSTFGVRIFSVYFDTDHAPATHPEHRLTTSNTNVSHTLYFCDLIKRSVSLNYYYLIFSCLKRENLSNDT